MKTKTGALALGALAALSVATTAPGGGESNDGEAVGLLDLLDRIGLANLPTGAGIVVGQVELPNGGGDYAPGLNDDEFQGKTFTHMSGVSGTSSHAARVGNNYYGLTLSIAPDIGDIFNWDVNEWVAFGFIRNSTGLLPLASPAGMKILNHSWIGAFASIAQNNDVLRRLDFVVTRDNLVVITAVDNDETNSQIDGRNLPLLSHAYNTILMGVQNGQHTVAPTLGAYDGFGRMQPQLLAPGGKVSWAAPVGGAAVALLTETARTTPTLAAEPLAERSEVLKAILMAGAAHRVTWTNNPSQAGADRGTTSQPLDATWGADTIDVNVSHYVLTRGRQPGSATTAGANPTALHSGWDLATVGVGESRFWRFTVCGTAAPTASIIATWHRHTEFPFGGGDWAVADFTIELWGVDGNEQLVSLVGNAGLATFANGNVVSSSTVDNVEHLLVRELEPGEYALEVRRIDTLATHPLWDVAVAWTVETSGPVGDFNDDCRTDTIDFLDLLGNWGPCPEPCPVEPCPGDTNGDCQVDTVDFLNVLGNWTG
jgi:hypothetical protein